MASTTESKIKLTNNSISEIKESINLEDVTSKHRKERRELQAKIQEMKKNAPKSDKKKRKEMLEEISKLEIDLEKRQAQQLNNLNLAKTEEKQIDKVVSQKNLTEEPDSLLEDESQNSNQRISKAQKRRNKKAEVAKEREKEILACQEDSKNAPKAVELKLIEKILKERNLSLYMIPSDGECLYNAVKHQLQLKNNKCYTVAELRQETANYIRNNKESLIYYMTDPDTGDVLTDDDFAEYCDNIQNTIAWGGQIELKALSSALKIPIEVLQAVGPPTIQGADEFSGQNLTITYHRHMYSLGEHYNSTQPIQLAKDNDESEFT